MLSATSAREIAGSEFITAPAARKPAGLLDAVSFAFDESMSGNLRLCPTAEHTAGTAHDHVQFDVHVSIADLGRFLRDFRHPATMTGTVSVPSLGGTVPISDGRVELFSVEQQTGMRQILYSFHFAGADGHDYCLRGQKQIQHRPWRFDLPAGMTRLFTRIYRCDATSAPVYAIGELRFHLLDTLPLLASMKVGAQARPSQRIAGVVALLSAEWGAIRNEYFKGMRLFYDTSYQNLILAGRLDAASGGQKRFCLVSGVHDKGFPWGDDGLFSDVLLVIENEHGDYARYAITDRILGGLEFDVPSGTYQYRGPISCIGNGASSFHQMQASAAHGSRVQADIEVEFDARACDAVPFPFPRQPALLRRIPSRLTQCLQAVMPGTNLPGVHIRPHALTVRSGSIRIARAADHETMALWTIAPAETFGECERGTFRNVKKPALQYRYQCTVEPNRRSATVRVAAGTLHSPQGLLGRAVARVGSAEMQIGNGEFFLLPQSSETHADHRVPLIELVNTQFPTAALQRRIVECDTRQGDRCFALQEDMSKMRLEAVHSDRTSTVACFRDENKYKALDQVLEACSFDTLLERSLQVSQKPRTSFLIAIKPNFMFAYDKRDLSTYTDPELVGHLVRHLRARGFDRICVVEAQCTYGEFFDKRSVRELAEYLGYDESTGYSVVDLTLDVDEHRQLGSALGVHPVPRTWRDADFRISFAKNKTHSYAYYSLTIKNIYGALPPANKFREYHCGRGLYATTIEYLAAFPVHFGLIDGYLSADGPFGVFAAPKPNKTATVIGGTDLVAVDWVGATKMGLDPMVSPHMQLAVQALGKPEIRLVGDANVYPAWRNAGKFITFLTNHCMDSNYRMGRFLYDISSQMDETHFHHKSKAWYVRLLRLATLPIRHTLFVHTRRST